MSESSLTVFMSMFPHFSFKKFLNSGEDHQNSKENFCFSRPFFLSFIPSCLCLLYFVDEVLNRVTCFFFLMTDLALCCSLGKYVKIVTA
jgi:hypothetical protein